MKNLAIFAGVLFAAFGIGGFVPSLNPDGLLLGIFEVNTLHAAAYLISGVLAIACGLAGEVASRNFFRAAGVVYALAAIGGFIESRTATELSALAMNTGDNVLHTTIAVLSLWLGFVRPGPIQPPPGPHRDLRELA